MPLIPEWMTKRGQPIVPADVIVYREGDYAVAVDGKTKQVIAHNKDHAEVIQKAIDHIADEGKGKIYIKQGEYILTSPIKIDTLSNIIIESDYAVIRASNNLVPETFGGSTVTLLGIRKSNNVIIKGLIMDGNKDNVSEFSVGLLISESQRILIYNNEIRNVRGHAIALWFEDPSIFSSDIYVIKNHMHDNVGSSMFKVQKCMYGIFMYNIIENSDQMGIELDPGTDKTILAYNVIRNTRHNGIEIDNAGYSVSVIGNKLFIIGTAQSVIPKSGGGYHYFHGIMVYDTFYTLIQGNEIWIPYGHGICIGDESVGSGGKRKIIIKDNIIINPSQASSSVGYFDGIRIVDIPTLIEGNIIVDTRSAPRMRYGISSAVTLDKDIIIKNNYISGYTTSAMYGVHGAKLIDNIGYVTMNSGVAVFSGDGSTTDFLIGEHGLSPTVDDPSNVVVRCSPASPDAISASPLVCYLSDEDGDGKYESIRVKFASAPPSGTNNVKVAWEAEYIG